MVQWKKITSKHEESDSERDDNFEDIRPLCEPRINDALLIESINEPYIIDNTEKSVNIIERNIESNETIEWYSDSGAYEHVTNDKSLLKDYKEDFVQLRCLNNTILNFEGYGSCEFTIKNLPYTIKQSIIFKKRHLKT